MIIAKLLEKLEQYVDIKMLGQLSAASVKKLIDYFNKNNIYGKMNMLPATVTYRGKVELIQKACLDYLKYKEDGVLSAVLEKQVIIPERLTNKYDAVIFMYFLFYENKLILAEADNENLFRTLADVYEFVYEDSIFQDVQSFALFCVLIWKQGIKEFNKYLDQIAGETELKGDLDNILTNKRTMSVEEFVDRMDELCMTFDTERDLRATRKSVEAAIKCENKIVSSIKNRNQDVPDKIEFIDFCNNHADYKKILDMILNTQKRRRWYLYRIIQKIVLKQLNDVADECDNVTQAVCITQRRRLYEYQMINPIVINDDRGGLKFNELYLFECVDEYDKDFSSKETWLKRNCIMSFDKICYIFEIMFDEKTLHASDNEREDHVAIARIFGKGVNGWIERCLARGFSDDKIIEIAVENKLIKFGKNSDEKIKEERKADFEKKIDMIREKLYERYNRLIDQYEKSDSVHGFGVRANEGLGDSFWNILTGRVDVTRELLLSFVMIAKVYSVDLQLEYIQYHILENSRFDSELEEIDESNYFNRLFSDLCVQIDDNLYSNMNMRRDLLTMLAAKMEKNYLMEGIAPFTAMVEGRSLG